MVHTNSIKCKGIKDQNVKLAVPSVLVLAFLSVCMKCNTSSFLQHQPDSSVLKFSTVYVCFNLFSSKFNH